MRGGVVGSKIFSALPSLNSFSKVRQYKIEPLLPSSLPFSLPSKFSCNVNVHMRAGSDPIRSVYIPSRTNIAISRLSHSQVVETKAFQLGSFDAVCKGNPVYRIVKTRDYNNCKSTPVWHTTTSNVYTCDFDKANCGDFLQVNFYIRKPKRHNFNEYLFTIAHIGVHVHRLRKFRFVQVHCRPRHRFQRLACPAFCH